MTSNQHRPIFHSGNYEIIAKVLRAHRSPPGNPYANRNQMIDAKLEDFAVFFKRDNKSFDVGKFTRATFKATP